jgi:HD-like signal output (HDOD) protein
MSLAPLSVRLDQVIAAGDLRLPLHPRIAETAAERLRAGEPTAETLTELISHDPVLTCALFRAANSAFYQGLPKAARIGDALARLGRERATAELLELCAEAVDPHAGILLPHYLPALHRHSLGCALGARWLAERCGYRGLAEQAHLAGLVHDIGKFPLLAGLEQVAGEEGTAGRLGAQLVEDVLASRHILEGLKLQAAWNLPDIFAVVIGRHHEQDGEGQDLLVALVRLANQGCHKLGLGWEAEADLVLPTTAEAQFLGIDEMTLAEFEIMLEDHPLLTFENCGDDGFLSLRERVAGA